MTGWETQRQLNGNSPEFEKVKDHFTGNLDESNFMCSDGNLHIIGGAEKPKTEKNISDNRDSTTAVRVGTAADQDGPRVFLAKAKSINLECMKNFCKHHTAPPGSFVHPTPNAYMTTEAWREICPKLCEGIRNLPVVMDHPEWWFLLSLDGFGAHLDPETLEMFAKYRILIVKEEGDTSQMCQAYDQHVAKTDKRFTREMLDGFKFNVSNNVDQWELILVANAAFNETSKTNSWHTSFIKVNMCPSKAISPNEWIKQREVLVKAADSFFTERSNLFDATPAAWQHLEIDQRRQVCTLMDTFDGKWNVENLRKVMQLGFVHLDNIDKLRGCYLLSKDDPTIILNPVPSAEEESGKKQSSIDEDYIGFAFKPKALVDAYKASGETKDKEPSCFHTASGRFFVHMSNFIAATHGWKSGMR